MGGDVSEASAGALDFPSTTLTTVLGAGTQASREHLERLCTRYWRPVYLFIRRVGARPGADPGDLTQAFFEHLLESNVLARFDPGEGNFRPWLKTCLRNFLAKQSRDAARLKRGGRRRFVPLEQAGPLPDPASPPEEEFDRAWTLDVLNHALALVEDSLRIRNRSVCFEVLKAYAIDRGGEDPPTYRDVAQRLGLKETDIRNHLHAVRLELEDAVRKVVAEYARDGACAREEAARILGTSP